MLDQRTELLYWLSIMRDHAIFQFNAFAPKEQEAISSAHYYEQFFQSMLDRAAEGENINAMQPEVLQGLLCFIDFMKGLIRGLLTCGLEMNFTPTFINHMINEAIEFQGFLTLPPPPEDPYNQAIALVDLHKIWIADAAGHASTFISFLDATEFLLIDEAKEFKRVFDGLTLKATELKTMLARTGLSNGALELLTEEAEEWILKFISYLEKIRTLRCQCKAMAAGTTSPLLPDHMIREERYYLAKMNR